MLKIKDNVELKELEKFGFEKDYKKSLTFKIDSSIIHLQFAFFSSLSYPT